MYNIDDIMDMLDWNQSKEEQEKGLKLDDEIWKENLIELSKSLNFEL